MRHVECTVQKPRGEPQEREQSGIGEETRREREVEVGRGEPCSTEPGPGNKLLPWAWVQTQHLGPERF